MTRSYKQKTATSLRIADNSKTAFPCIVHYTTEL